MIDESLRMNFYPPPMISGSTNMSGRDVWYDRRRCRLTVDPEDLFLSDRALIEKYGTAFYNPSLPESDDQ